MIKSKFISILFLAAAFIICMPYTALADFTVSAGDTWTLAADENFIVDGNLTIEAGGTLDASAANTNISLSGNWTNSGTFIPGTDSTVTFTDSGTVSNITGNTTFNNFACVTASKQLTFEAGVIQTINDTLTLNGQASGTEIQLRSSTAGTRWTFDVVGSDQAVEYVDVQDSQSSTNNIVAKNSIYSGNTDRLEPPAHWVFGLPAITSPTDGKTVGRQPTIIGTAGPGDTIDIYALVGGVSTKVATVTADTNGNFRVMQSDFTAQLDTGANSLTPKVGSIAGTATNINVVTNPTTDQVPTIDSHSDGDSVRGATPTIIGKGLAGQTVTLTAHDADGNLLLSDVASSTVDASGNYTINASDYTIPLVKSIVYLSVRVDGVNSLTIAVTFVDPYGVVFDSASDNPVEGAVVTIYYDNDPGPGRTWIPAVVGTHIAPGDVNPVTTAADGFYSYNCIAGDFRIDIAAGGYKYPSDKAGFPAGRAIVTGSKGETFTIGAVIIEMDHPADPSASLLRIEKDANKKEVSIGDIVTYTVTLENISSGDVTNIYLEDKIPAGFKYISGKCILDNQRIADPTGGRPLSFNIGTVASGETRTLKYQLVVGSGVTFGDYRNRAFAKYSDGTVISNTAVEKVEVVPDPLFDLGTVIGKVFHDRNENGIQDRPRNIGRQVIVEEPIPNVVIVTEEGTVITTDKDGKYHLAGIIPGRHLLRLDERTLPDGAYLTTDKVVIVDVTPGILRKVNFGVRLPDDGDAQKAPFKITRDRGTPEPRLNVSLFNDELIVKDGRLEERAEFRIFTNYHLFIKNWKLEILNKDTRQLVTEFGGPASDIFKPIYLDLIRHKSLRIKADRDYVYRLTVTGAGGKEDVTKEREFRVQSSEFEVKGKEKTEKEKAEEYGAWMERESGINNLEKQTIGVKGETIQLSAISRQLSAIKIVKAGKVQAEIPVIESQGLRAKDLLKSSAFAEAAADKQGRMEVIFPRGEYEIRARRSEDGGTEVRGQRPEVGGQTAEVGGQRSEDGGRMSEVGGQRSEDGGQRTDDGRPAGSETYSKHIKVGDDYLFFVAMGDAKIGHTFNRGNIEPVEHDDKFKEGFWSEGKLAYYLKGKIKGKYLITSSFDSERKKKELFKNLDPDKYYPVYGDESSINYNATDTQGMLYLLIEWDKSSAIWGNYNTAFTDTEFAQFSRSLYGGKVHLETVAATRFGEPNAKLVLFKASAQQKAAHNEFTGTGGSLYYLKHKDVIEGSDKVRIEVRDKITGLVLAKDEMQEGADYEIDYSNGRITFWRPISQISESNSIISTHLLDGNPVYVVADYEYEVMDEYDQGTVGGRVQKSITDYVSVGGTYVKEEQAENDYELKGTDATIHLGKDIQITAEYAESESEATGSFISTDGGLSFTELPTDQHAQGKAYGVKGDAHLFGDKLGLSAYYKKIEKGFSTSGTSSQQGKELTGFGATYDPTGKTSLTVSHDIQELLADGNPQTRLQVGATRTETTSAQITHDMATDKLKLTAEMRHQKVTERKEEFDSETNTEEDVLAVKADYKLTDNIDVFLEQQATLKGEDNNQTTGGMEVEVFDWLSLRGAETVGTKGNATSVGATANVQDRLSISADYTKANYKTGEAGDAASLSANAQIDEKTEVHGTYALTDGTDAPTGLPMSDSQLTGSTGNGKTHSLTLGSKKKLNDIWELTGDTTFASSKDTRTYGSSTGLVREKDGRSLEGTFTRQHSESSSETSNSNIFGLSGDINDRWAAFGTFEKGGVRYHDGTDASRYAGSLGFGFVDRDEETDDIRLKASSKLELRFDNGDEDKRQYLFYGAAEGKVTPDTTLFTKANLSQTKNTTTDTTEAQYKELVFGTAYRPIDFDWLNLLAKYTYLEDDAPVSQSGVNDIEAEKAHVLAAEAVIDLSDKWQLSEKLAYKTGEEKVTGFDFTKTSTWLWINRLGYNINEDWQAAGEYRILAQKQAEDKKHGALFEVSRNIGDYFQVGVGYNLTEFNDDLTHLDYTSHGPYIRITAKFFDRSAKEKARAAKRIKKRQKEHAERFLEDEGESTGVEHKFLEIDKVKPVPKDKQKIGIKVSGLEDESEGTIVKHKFLEIDKIKPVPKDKQKIGLKVLSGDGDVNSAKAMANELENLGYKVAHIEMGHQPNFMENTVYYAPNFQNEAKRLADSLADKPALKPLRLPSIFDIIVVTGKKPAETDKATSLPGDKKKIYMKVLSGDGDVNFARAMANELENLGYKVAHIEMASRSSSMQNTVFYAPDFQNEARRLADSLAGKPVLKPISWPSIFDIIVVTGRENEERNKGSRIQGF